MRITRQHRSIAVEHGNSSTFAKREGSKEFCKGGRVDAPRQHTKKNSMRASERMADDCVPFASEYAENRFNPHLRLRVRLEKFEIRPMGDTHVDDWQQPRPID